MEFGEVQGKARMGITFVPISQATAELTGSTAGLMVQSISPDCDVANTDLAPGDLITKINDKDVNELEDVPTYVQQELTPGDDVTVHVIRKTESKDEEYDFTFKLMSDRGTLVEKKK